MAVARSLGLAIPGDVSVVGFDNVPESALGEPPLTTVEQPIQQMGIDAVRLLIDLIEDPSRATARVVLPTRLVVRQSCRAIGDARMTDAPSTRLPTATRRRPVAERVEDLLARMTVEEKVAQLGSAWVFQLARRRELLAGSRRGGARRARARPGDATLRRQQLRARGGAAVANEIQGYLVEETRLGIPAIVHEEICSGLMAREADRVPAGDRRREHLGARARRARSRPPSARRCARSARTRASRRCSTSAAIHAGAAPRRRSARIRTSSRAWASSSCAGCRATTCATASSRPRSTSSATARRRAA